MMTSKAANLPSTSSRLRSDSFIKRQTKAKLPSIDSRNKPSSSMPHTSKRALDQDEDVVKYSLKYKEAKIKLKSAQETYYDVQLQLNQARKAINRLKARNSLLLTELNKDVGLASTPRDLKNLSNSFPTRAHKAPLVVDKDGFAVPSLPAEHLGYRHTFEKASPQSNSERSGQKISRRSRRDLTQARRVQPVPQDENGRYILPVNIGILTVVSLGAIEHENPKFHNERYIWPVGYTVKRYYNSTVDPEKQACYTASIINDNGNPCFQIIADDNPNPIYGITATGAWTAVVRLANRIRARDHSNSASGPDYYGFSHPTIAKMIQDLPNAHLCNRYNWQDFEMMDPKHVPTRKWHVPPADDPPNSEVSPKNSRSQRKELKPTQSDSRPSADLDSKQDLSAMMDDLDADKLLSQSDSGSSPSEEGYRLPHRSGREVPSRSYYPERKSSSPLSDADFAAVM